MSSTILHRLFIISLLFLFWCCSASAQPLLEFKTGVFYAKPFDASYRTATVDQYVFYTSDHVLTRPERDELQKDGIEILYALKQKVYWVRIKGTPSIASTRNLFTIDPAYKSNLSIDDRSSSLRIRASIAPGLSLSEIEAWAAKENIRLLDTRAAKFGFIDIQINASSYQTILNTPWISFIEEIPIDEVMNYRLLNAERGWGLISPLTRGLNGSGMTVGIGDEARIGTHQDLSSSLLDLASYGISNHSTEVAGIVTGAGLLDPSFGFGYAPKADVLVRNFSDILWTTPQYVEDYNLSLTNNSYSANPFNCTYIGDYTGSSAALDAMMQFYPTLLHVFAAGNSGTATCAPYPIRYATVAGGYQSAKNVLTVGAINISDAVVNFSSRGPVDDGRLKPEIVTYGQNRFSTINGNSYTTNSGTSFSSPASMGVATLLYERYKQLHNDSLPDAALIKNIMCNGADDLGRPGPDYEYGFGRMNGVRSVEIIENNHYDTVLLDHNGIVFKSFSVPSGTASIDIMLLWTDVASAPYETEALVNDLDLIVIDPSGDTIRPWKLNYTPTGITLNATTGADHHNNYEQVTVPTAETGLYTLMIKGHHVPAGPQLAWITWDVQRSGITVQSPIGGEVFKPGNINLPNDRQYIRWDAFGTGNATFLVEYSKHPDSAWVVVANNIPADRRFQDWFVPAIHTDKLRIRVTATNGLQDTSDADAVIMPPPSNFTCTSPCNGYLQLNWNAVAGAASYEVYRLYKENLILLESTSSTSIVIGGFPSDTAVWLSVAGVFPSGKKGLRPKALLRTANGGNNCTWPHDLRLDSLLYPQDGRQFTSSSLSSGEKLTVFISNAGQQNATGFSLSYRVNNGSVVTETFTDTILPGTGQSFGFNAITDFAGPGNYLVKVWTTYTSDILHDNDTIIQTITHFTNSPLTLPWLENFESIPDATTTQNIMGLPGLDAWDVTLGQEGRIRTYSGSPFCHSGERSLTMDVTRSVSNSHGELLLTLNMDNYSVVGQDIRMSFYHMHHELLSDLSNTEAVWIRGSDMDTFVLLTILPNEPSERGEWKYFSGLEITQLLSDSGQDFSSSFQVRFVFDVHATAGQINSEDGLTIDDIAFEVITRDIKVDELIHPSVISCGLGTETIQVEITNTSNKEVTVITAHYRINGGLEYVTAIGSIQMESSAIFSLTPAANFSGPGVYDLEIWVKSPDDDFPLNDTSRFIIQHSPLVDTYPYKEGFESGTGDWLEGGINSSWAHGSPGKEFISRAAEGDNAWVTGLTQEHNADEISYLYSPCFDLNGLTQPYLSFALMYQLEVNYDYAWVEYRTGNSTTWTKLGAQNSGTNWYNHNSNTWNGNQLKWVTSGIAIPVNNTTVQFRWVMFTDVGVEYDGIAIDQVHVYDRVPIYTGNAMQMTIPVSGNNWVHFDQSGSRLFSIHPNNQNLGNVTLSLFKSVQNFTNGDSLYLASRNWVVTSTNQPASDILMRGYLTATEASNLVNATGCSQCTSARDGFDVAALRYTGPNQDGTYSNNTASLVDNYETDETQVYPFDIGYYAEWTSPGLSEWWITSPVTHQAGSISRRINTGDDDAEEHHDNGSVNPIREYLALTEYDGDQKIGLRFRNITVPTGSYISSATLTFTSSDTASLPLDLTIQSETVNDAITFKTSTYNISLRPRSTQMVNWSPSSWTTDEEYISPDIRHVVQEIIDRPGWLPGNDIVFVMRGDGLREAWSYDGAPAKAPLLQLTFSDLCMDQGIVYVNHQSTGNQNGSSWMNAYKTLEQALDRVAHCTDISQIWIAGGTYSPHSEVSRSAGFKIPQGVQVYGGFQGNETLVSQRIYNTFPTILSGDIGIVNISSDNLYHVVSILPGTDPVILDGIRIEKGMANGSMIQDQRGSGIYNEGKLSGHQVLLQNNSAPSAYNGPGSQLTSTGIIEIKP